MGVRIDQLGLTANFVCLERDGTGAPEAISFRVYCKGKPYVKVRYDGLQDHLTYTVVKRSAVNKADDQSAVRDACQRLIEALDVSESVDLDELMRRMVRREMKRAVIDEHLDRFGWFLDDGEIVRVDKERVGQVLTQFPDSLYVNGLSREAAGKILARHLGIV